ncbi:MAG: S-ribosylhomocysteine lyase [Ruminococcaceae bacterium]|nr:S-ribosylhomocysteine lyase [Oscillospiraceae bacterium]
MELKKIASFEVDHNTLERGIYTSRIDGDIVTYDIRLKKPNGGDYLKNGAMHTAEHIIATYVRNSEHSDKIIYFGPMGCRTGFYLLVRDLDPTAVIELLKNAFKFLRDFEGEIPGVSAVECGNYLEHDLETAKMEAENYLPCIENWTVENLKY